MRELEPNLAPLPDQQKSNSLDEPSFADCISGDFARDFLLNGCFFALGSTDLLIAWGEWTPASQPGHSACAVYAPDFYMTDAHPWRLPAHFRIITREIFATTVLPKLKAEVNSDFDQRFQWVEPVREGFEEQVRTIRERFRERRLVKAVPVVHAQALEIMTQGRLLAVLEKMNACPASLIPQGFWDAKRGEGLLGATPERLFLIEKNETGIGGPLRLVTMALAGTRGKSASGDVTGDSPGDVTGELTDDAQKLMNDPKERREHQIVIDDLVERLSKYGVVDVGETVIAELPTLYHLKTQITVTGETMTFEALARDLHPTPALGVAPRAFGLANMKQWDDTLLRGRYGAPFGVYLRTEKLEIQDCLVAIRNVQWSNSQAPTLGSGCGFVEESTNDREWSELQLKRESVKKVLNV
jgi:menaquinone-specific isochorismate synthase